MALKKGTVLKTAFDRYTIQEQRGTGGSGTVYKAIDAEGTAYAIKVLDKSKATATRLKRFKNEIAFCAKNSHKNIIQVLGCGVTDEDETFYVMPLYSGTLRDLISKGIESGAVLAPFTQILDGIEAAHLLGVWHRDLKPENILYSSATGSLVLADFGIAHFEEEELLTLVVTKPDERLANFLYAAPEQKIKGRSVDNKADIYALGLILHEMITREVPLGTAHTKVADVAPAMAYLDPLIELMRNQDPPRRPSIGDVKRELIARGQQFVERQHLDKLKREVVPESEVSDRLITDPIRILDKLDYRDGILTLKLNQPVNEIWVACFKKRATRYTANFSAAMVAFSGYHLRIRASDHFLGEGLRFVNDYIPVANEDYAALVKQEHRKEIEKQRVALQSKVREEEARLRILDRIKV